jgi:hypothetical protein
VPDVALNTVECQGTVAFIAHAARIRTALACPCALPG